MAALAPLTPLNGSNCNLVDEIDGEANWPGAQGKRPTARAPISPSPSLHPSLPTPPLSLVPTASVHAAFSPCFYFLCSAGGC